MKDIQSDGNLSDIGPLNLPTKDAIEKRRSIRKFKQDPVPDEHIMALIEAARLAPSASNTQPWRFKIVSDDETKAKLAEAAYRQSFVAQAPVVLSLIHISEPTRLRRI